MNDTDRAIADIKKHVGGFEAEPQHRRTQPGDSIAMAIDFEPHVTVDVLTGMQMSVLARGQALMRKAHGEPPPTDADRDELFARVSRLRLLARALELALSGHAIIDADPESALAFRFCRYWVAPDESEAAPPPASGLVDVDGAPLERTGPQLVVPG